MAHPPIRGLRCEPTPQSLIYRRMVEQVPVIQAVTDPLVACGESQPDTRIVMPAQCAVHRHQTISDRVVTANARRNCEAPHPFGQRHRLPAVPRLRKMVAPSPIVVQQVTVAQIFDPSTADTRDARQRSAITTQAQSDIYQVSDTFQCRAMVRRTEKNEVSHASRPAMPRRHTVSVSAAGYKPAAAVADNRYVPHRHGPLFEESFHQLGESAPVGGDVQATVVMQMHRRPSEVLRQRRRTVTTTARPLQVIHAKAMNQDENFPARPRDGGLEIPAFQWNRVAVPAQTHGYGERVLSGVKMIAQNAVHDRQHSFAFRRRLNFAGRFNKRSDDGFHTVTDEIRDCVHRRISHAHHATEGVPRNCLVHCLDNRSHSSDGVDTQSAEAQKVGGSHGANEVPLCYVDYISAANVKPYTESTKAIVLAKSHVDTKRTTLAPGTGEPKRHRKPDRHRRLGLPAAGRDPLLPVIPNPAALFAAVGEGSAFDLLLPR